MDPLDKSRPKVRKACDNCRKRKLRCTGKQPCSTCEAYNCPCIYSVRSSNARRGRVRKIQIVQTPSTTTNTTNTTNTSTASSPSVALPASSHHNSNNTGSLPATPSGNPSGVPSSSALPQLHYPDGSLSSGSSVSAPYLSTGSANGRNMMHLPESIAPVLPASAPVPVPQGPLPVPLPQGSLATPLMSEVPPVISGDDHLYLNDEAFQVKVNALQTTLNTLRQVAVPDAAVAKCIDDLDKQLQELIAEWRPHLDLPKFRAMEVSTPNKSIETALMRNKYTERVCLTRYAIWSDANNAQGKPAQLEPDEPLITEMFGLYSPFQAISFRGIGYIALAHLRRNNGTMENSVKDSMYLILRYFDMCFLQLAEGKALIANPLENYTGRKNLAATPQSPEAPVATPSPTSSNGGSAGGGGGGFGIGGGPATTASAASSKRSVIAQCIRNFPQPFTHEVTGVSLDTLLDTMCDSLPMFQLLLKMFNQFKVAYEAFLIDNTVSANRQRNNGPTTFPPGTVQKLLFFSEMEQLLLALSYQYYAETQFFYYKTSSGIDYLEMLLSLVDKQLSSYDYYSATLVMDAAVNRALKMGLYRWEYYVGLDEAKAERRRRIWWGLYYFDKLICVTLGEPSTINDTIMSCLLPRVFRDIGFLDNRTFVNTVHTFQPGDTFDKMDIPALVNYGRVGILQLVSDFQINVLYNEKYTSIRNTALPPLVKARLFQELVASYDLLRAKMQALRNHCTRLFDLASSPRNENGDAVLNGVTYKCADINAASRFSCSFEYHFSVALSTMDNLESRLSSPPYTNPQAAALVDIFHEIYYSWNRMNLFLSNFTNDYSFIRVFMYYRCISIFFITKANMLKDIITLEDIKSMVMALHKFRCLWIITLNENYPQVRESSLYKEFCKDLSFLCLGCRILTHTFVQNHSITIEKIKNWFQQNSPDLVDTFENCMDISSPSYKYLLMPVQRSGFHLHVRKMLETNFMGKGKAKGKGKHTKHGNVKVESGATGPLGPPHLGSPLVATPVVYQGPAYKGAAPVSSMISSDGSSGGAFANPSASFSSGSNAGNPMPRPVGPPTGPGDFADPARMAPGVNNGPIGNGYPFMENPHQSDVYMRGREGQRPGMGSGQASSLASSFNLGTLDEFVNSDIGNIYNILWSDLYPGADSLN